LLVTEPPVDWSRTVPEAMREGLRSPLVQPPADQDPARLREAHEARMALAERQQAAGEWEEARGTLVGLLRGEVAEDLQRRVLIRLADVAVAQGRFSQAQHMLAQYTVRYPEDPGTLEVYLRQGLLHREMGATTLALSKFYAVMTAALRLRLEQLEPYQRLVLRAQTEIAETHFLTGRWDEAVEFFQRLLKLDTPMLNRARVHGRLVKTLALMGNAERTSAQATQFLREHPEDGDGLEIRFLLAQALKTLGRNEEALKQVLELLESTQAGASTDAQTWVYWRKRAGNEIGNQLYQEGDYLSTLAIYQRMAALDSAPEWVLPVWYQMGLVWERLGQPEKASALYSQVVERGSATLEEAMSPGLQTIMEMSQWRLQRLAWVERTQGVLRSLESGTTSTNLSISHVQPQ
jgi:tetratricopeptide (TPR) repeat protein